MPEKVKAFFNPERVVTSVIILVLSTWLIWSIGNIVTSAELQKVVVKVDDNTEHIADIKVTLTKFLESQEAMNALLAKQIAGHTLEISELAGKLDKLKATQALQIEHINESLVDIKKLLEKLD